MAKPPFVEWMPFHGDRFFGDLKVVALSDHSRLLYIVLLWRQWVAGCIPSETSHLQKISTLGVRTFRTSWIEVEQFFPVCDDGMRRNQTLGVMRLAAEERSERYAENVRRINENRARDSSRKSLRVSSRDPRRDGEEEGETLPPPPTRVRAREDDPAPLPPPPPRLLGLLSEWERIRTPLMPKAPRVTPALTELFMAVDTPDRNWTETITAVATTPATNGTATPRKNYPTPFVATVAWVLKPANLAKIDTEHFAKIQSLTGGNSIDDMLARVALQATMEHLKANPKELR